MAEVGQPAPPSAAKILPAILGKKENVHASTEIDADITISNAVVDFTTGAIHASNERLVKFLGASFDHAEGRISVLEKTAL